MISLTSFTIANIFLFTIVSARYVDKDGSNGYPAKLFDYYDVAKGNIPTYLTEVDKPLEPFQEDSEPVKLNGMVDNNIAQMMRQEHAIEVQPSENRPETLESYDEYAEESVNKPLETHGVGASATGAVDGETISTDTDSKTAEETPLSQTKADSKSTGIVPVFVPVTPTPAASNETEPISNVEDVMILRTIKPLCSIHEPCD